MHGAAPKASIETLLRQEPVLALLFSVRETFPDAEVYLVGGAVRDALRNRPCQDFDFVVRGVPEEELAQWMRVRGAVSLVGKTFGVYKFIPAGSSLELDVALPRTERAHPGGQGNPRAFTIETNAFLPIIEDLARRDFTINAMAFELNTGTLYDPFSGLRDLEAKVIRAVGDPTHRFEEDLSRILRAVRFACELNMTIEPKTWNALKQLAPRLEDRQAPTAMSDRLRGKPGAYVIARETVGRELLKSLAANVSLAVSLWRESGLLQAVAPPLYAAFPLNVSLTLSSSRVALAFFLAPLGTIAALQLYESLVLSDIGMDDPRFVSRDDVALFVHLFERMARDEDPSTWGATDFADVCLVPCSEDLLRFLATAEIHLPAEKLEAYRQTIERMVERRTRMIQSLGAPNVDELPPLLSGVDVMRITNLPGGPTLGILMKKLRDAQLDGQVKTPEEARNWLQSN